MGRPYVEKSKKLEKYVSIAITEEQFIMLKQLAYQTNQSIGKMLSKVLDNWLNSESINEITENILREMRQ